MRAQSRTQSRPQPYPQRTATATNRSHSHGHKKSQHAHNRNHNRTTTATAAATATIITPTTHLHLQSTCFAIGLRDATMTTIQKPGNLDHTHDHTHHHTMTTNTPNIQRQSQRHHNYTDKQLPTTITTYKTTHRRARNIPVSRALRGLCGRKVLFSSLPLWG